MVVGILFTAVVQSSSATTVMVVSFVNSGLMTLLQATGVILGANIGTTVTGQLIAFNLSDIAPLFVIIGVVMVMFCKKGKGEKCRRSDSWIWYPVFRTQYYGRRNDNNQRIPTYC